MAEVPGSVASIAQIANTGDRLSAVLYDIANGDARAEQDEAELADHVKAVAAALDGVGKIITQEDGAFDVSETALSEASDLTKRCDTVFADIQKFLQERDGNQSRDEKSAARPPGPSKEQRTELLRCRLDSLKHSILLLLHVLRLANAQAKGNVESNFMAEEAEAIRDLHKRQQHSHKALQALESRLGDALLSDDETLHGSAAPSRVPTINFLVHSSARDVSSDRKASQFDRRTVQAPSALGDNPETSDGDNSDETVTDDDEDLTVRELAQCATHAEKLLKRITALKQSSESSRAPFPRNKVLKIYRRFCRQFESAMLARPGATPMAAPLPNIPFPSEQTPRVEPHVTTHEEQPLVPHQSHTPTDRFANNQIQPQLQQNNTDAARPTAEGQFTHAPPAWTISSEPLGPGSRPKLPPLISATPRTSQASPTNEIMSPCDEQDAKHSGTDGDAEHGSHEPGPVVYTKTGRISKAKKGLKVHVCEECGRSFTRAEHLRRHQKNHGPNQVRCELCGKVFFRADLLQRHLERHKDLPQGYRFSNASAPGAEDASPVAADDQHHRNILPAPGTTVPQLPPHQSPGGRSANSSGASGAPTPSDVPAVPSHQIPAWETRAQLAATHAQEEKTSQRPNTWQTVNAHAHVSSPSVQQSHPGLPKLQPKPDMANGASAHKRYSSILPAPGASSTSNQQPTHPQEHMPNMLPAQYQSSSAPTPRTTVGPATYQESHQPSQGHSLSQGGHIHASSPTATFTSSVHGVASQSDQSNTMRSIRATVPNNSSRSFPDGHLSNMHVDSGKLSSDKDGVNWRLAEADTQPYRKRKHYRTVSHTEVDPSASDGRASSHSAHRTPDILHRSRSGSRSLSLVMPQDDRDHALLGTSRPDTRQLPEVVSPHGGPIMTALSPSLAQRSTSRPSTGVSEPAKLQISTSGKVVSGPESPEPESPYSLATINRYIQNQGPQPGVQDHNTESSPLPISMNPCERCREYSIRCDGKLPSCTACATTKYAGECSFASMSAHPALAVVSNAGPPGSKFYDNIPTLPQHAATEPRGQILHPPSAPGHLHPGQDYNSEEDLPSPYLRPRDKQHIAQVPSTSLEGQPETQASRKRKADGDAALQDGAGGGENGGRAHERKRSKGEHADSAAAKGKGKGKDIVDLLLKEWTVPVT